MPNTVISLKKSSTPASEPLSLEFGEIAINYSDGKIFFKNATGSIVSSNLLAQVITNCFGIANINNTLITADLPGDVFRIDPGTNITFDINAAENRFTINSSGGDIGPPFDKANSANIVASSAYNKANSALANTSDATFAGNLDITGEVAVDSKIGIGTRTPLTPLHIVSGLVGGSSEVFRIVRPDQTSGGTAFGNDAGGALRLTTNTGSRWALGSTTQSSDDRIIYNTSNGFDHVFDHAGVELARIKSEGGMNVPTHIFISSMNVAPAIQAAFAAANAAGGSSSVAAFDKANSANIVASAAYDAANNAGGAGGTNLSIQYSNNSIIDGSNSFYFNPTTNTVVISENVAVSKISANGSFGTDGQVLTSNGNITVWKSITGLNYAISAGVIFA